jgi:hypothetical protein
MSCSMSGVALVLYIVSSMNSGMARGVGKEYGVLLGEVWCLVFGTDGLSRACQDEFWLRFRRGRPGGLWAELLCVILYRIQARLNSCACSYSHASEVVTRMVCQCGDDAP